MNPSTRTSPRKSFAHTSIQTLRRAAQGALNAAQQKAYYQGKADFETSTRDHPPYGFSDLKQAWKRGWLEASQRKEKLG